MNNAVKRLPTLGKIGKTYTRKSLPQNVRDTLSNAYNKQFALNQIDAAIAALNEIREHVATDKPVRFVATTAKGKRVDSTYPDFVSVFGYRIETESEAQERIAARRIAAEKEIKQLERGIKDNARVASKRMKELTKQKLKIDQLKKELAQ